MQPDSEVMDVLPHAYTPINLPESTDDLGLNNFEGGADNEDDAIEVVDAENALLNGGLEGEDGQPICAVCALAPGETDLHDLGTTSADNDTVVASAVALVMDEWNALVAAGVCTGPGPCDTSPTGTGNNWVTKAGGLPRYIRAIAHAMKRNGRSESQAVQIAIGICKRWAKGLGNVTAATKARAAAAIAEWEALKARGHVASAVFAEEVTAFEAEFGLTAGGWDDEETRAQAGQPGQAKPAQQWDGASGGGWDEKKHPRSPVGQFAPLSQGDGYKNEDGTKNKRVKHVQRMLKRVGISVGAAGVDGKLGPDTAAAIRSFQQAHGLKVTGVVNKHTVEKLHHSAKAHTDRRSSTPKRTYAQREHHRIVKQINTLQRGTRRLDRKLHRIVRDANTGNSYYAAGGGVTAATVTGQPTSLPVSGVVLKAQDTGRVLMLQRGLGDEDDPAAGMWEFPGGKPEDGDLTSLHTGVREWQEEVGQPFPEGGVVADTWRSPNGVYQGHVVVIPEEKAVCLHQGRAIDNPDDPDGDESEQVAWWDPADARKNPALRTEVKATPWSMIDDAAIEPGDEDDEPAPVAASGEPGDEGSQGPFESEYGQPHVYARSVHSGSGNCVCGREKEAKIHTQIAPGIPNPASSADDGQAIIASALWDRVDTTTPVTIDSLFGAHT